MSNVIAPFLFLVIAAGLFFSYIDPAYTAVQALKVQEGHLDAALTGAKQLQERRQTLLKQYGDFSDTDLSRLKKLLPDNIDNVRLLIDIDSIAATYGLTVRNYTFSTGARTNQTAGAEDAEPVGTAQLSFVVTGPYQDFKSFLFDIESSLRLMDITSFSVNADSPLDQADGTTATGNSYTVAVQTYWLK